jgi:hypothetical protein
VNPEQVDLNRKLGFVTHIENTAAVIREGIR